MSLEVQIQSFIYSFAFGIFFSFMINFHYRFLFSGKRSFRLVFNLLFVVVHVMLYFLFLKMINSGVIHIYFLMMIFVGFLFGNYYTKKIRKYWLTFFIVNGKKYFIFVLKYFFLLFIIKVWKWVKRVWLTKKDRKENLELVCYCLFLYVFVWL